MTECGVMPKESVTDPDVPGAPAKTHVLVGWSPELGVQVGVELPLPIIVALYDDPEITTAMNKTIREFARSDDSGPDDIAKEVLLAFANMMAGTMGNGLWVTMSRTELNRAIRVLRRARDAAYGKDE